MLQADETCLELGLGEAEQVTLSDNKLISFECGPEAMLKYKVALCPPPEWAKGADWSFLFHIFKIFFFFFSTFPPVHSSL